MNCGARAVEEVQSDLATVEGVNQLYAKIGNRRVDALLATAGRTYVRVGIIIGQIGTE